MDKEKELAELAVKAAKPIKEENGLIRVATHYDADGICAGAIMYYTLKVLNKNFKIHFIRPETKDIKELSEKEASLYIFTDVGSGQLEAIKEYMGDKKVVVADHHHPQKIEWENLHHFNCHLVGIDGVDEISGAGVTYVLSRVLTEKAKDLINLAILGATADMQATNGEFKSINKLLLEDAKRRKLIRVEKGLRLFGRYSRPLHKALEYSMDPYIPGISGNESGAIQFLHELGIPVRENGKWRSLADLTREEEKKLATALAVEGVIAGNEVNSLIGDVHILPNKYELREFATILNACGRTEKPMAGLKLCLNEKDNAEEIIANYRRKLSRYLNWVESHKNEAEQTDKVTYLIAKNSINENFVSPVTSIVVNSIFNTSIMFGFANGNKCVKVSARLKREFRDNIDLGELLHKAAIAVNGEGGGHSRAAGATIPMDSEKEFIKITNELINEVV